MSTAYGGFQLGLLPERKINKRAVAAAYGIVALALLIVINLELLSPERLELRQYHVTEPIPMPSLRPEPAPIKVAAVVKPKLLPAAKLPVFEQPKLVMPKEIRRELPQPVERLLVAAGCLEAGGLGARPELLDRLLLLMRRRRDRTCRGRGLVVVRVPGPGLCRGGPGEKEAGKDQD